MNGLSHLHGVTCKEHFTVCLIRGLGGNLPVAVQAKLANEVKLVQKQIYHPSKLVVIAFGATGQSTELDNL